MSVAFEQLVTQWTPKIEKVVRQREGYVSGFDADDLRQELLVVLWRCAERYNPNRVSVRTGKPASFHTYLHRAIMNRLMNLRGSMQRHHAPITVSLERIVSVLELGLLKGTRLERIIFEAVAVMPTVSLEAELEVMGLSDEAIDVVRGKIEGLTYGEIGQRRGCDVGRVKEVMGRTRKQLKLAEVRV